MRQLGFVVVLLFALTASGAQEIHEPVTVVERDAEMVLSNGILSARINRNSGEFALSYQGQTVISKGYWSQVGRTSGGDIGKFGARRSSTVTISPQGNNGERAEVSCQFQYDVGSGGLPCDVDMRYSLGRGEQGLYVYAIWQHHPGTPGFSVGEARHALKLNPALFDYLAIDQRRHGLLPSGAEWDAAEPLNMKEARRIRTGPFAGKAEHKYDYSAILADTPAYGWASTRKQLGVWLINPTIEYLAGGPTKVELTGHLDVNPGGTPVLLNMWHGSHYGGSSLMVQTDEAWSKVVGPFLYYCNSGREPEALWRDAIAKAKEEQARWPYDWVKAADYPQKGERGTVVGQLTVKDAAAPKMEVRNLQVGLASAPYNDGAGRGGQSAVDWQRDSKHYQFWTKADDQGRFRIGNVRPGHYTLYAFGDGVLGEFSRTNIVVKALGDVDLGKLDWKPVRHGKQIWEIGIPNRSAEEFRHGDHYWQWGLYLDYPKEFPQDVNFVVGRSDWTKDWNYCQPPRGVGKQTESTTWTITFDMAERPKTQATLRLGIAGSRVPRGIEVLANGKSAGSTGPLPDTGVMHRDGIRGYWCERSVTFDGALLRQGTNTIQLRVPSNNWTQGVLYDYLRLEMQ